MRVMIAGGGTGGHLFPGIAVAREFGKRDSTTEILFVGTEQGMEARVLPREGFRLETIPIKGIKGRGLGGLVEAAYGLPLSLVRSFLLVGRFRPDCIIGLGGYASGPVVIAGKIRGVRCFIMEQNLRPGLTNRIVGRIVDRVFTSFAATAAYLRGASVVETGNPVRWETLPESGKSEKFTILVFGGSAGAHRLNVAVLDALQKLRDLACKIKLIHQTGAADLAAVKSAYGGLPFEAEPVGFIEAMDRAYTKADLVIARAGATTVAELTVFGKAAILVPYPFAAHDHQRLNAMALEEAGAAQVILDRELDGERLAAAVRSLYADRSRVAAMAAAAKRLGRPGAAQRIVDECLAAASRAA
jgi:UDP-N-acetylglucosamine--N-acetylmuramyl-(pentapeptide) pyrophosphoryl-undecaprenol N-acetylglucosamine transferase